VIVAALVGAMVLAGCSGASGEQRDDFVAVHDQHVGAAAAVMELFPDAEWTARQQVVWCEHPDSPYNVPPRSRVSFSMYTPNLEGGLADVEQYSVSPEQLAEVMPQIFEIFTDAGWDAEDYSDDTRGSLQVGGNDRETYQTSFFVTVAEEGVEIKGRTGCVIGDRDALEGAIRETPTPWDEDLFETPVYAGEWALD
jgi:hypothetical protein